MTKKQTIAAIILSIIMIVLGIIIALSSSAPVEVMNSIVLILGLLTSAAGFDLITIIIRDIKKKK